MRRVDCVPGLPGMPARCARQGINSPMKKDQPASYAAAQDSLVQIYFQRLTTWNIRTLTLRRLHRGCRGLESLGKSKRERARVQFAQASGTRAALSLFPSPGAQDHRSTSKNVCHCSSQPVLEGEVVPSRHVSRFIEMTTQHSATVQLCVYRVVLRWVLHNSTDQGACQPRTQLKRRLCRAYRHLSYSSVRSMCVLHM